MSPTGGGTKIKNLDEALGMRNQARTLSGGKSPSLSFVDSLFEQTGKFKSLRLLYQNPLTFIATGCFRFETHSLLSRQ